MQGRKVLRPSSVVYNNLKRGVYVVGGYSEGDSGGGLYMSEV
jgi:hypothetical protein